MQNRIGKNGKIFKIYKYNTMVSESEKMLEILLKHNENLKNEYIINRKLKEDPRVTKVGKILRAKNLDEFPQFINILKGDMSLVEPRPYMEKEKIYMYKYIDELICIKPKNKSTWFKRYNKEYFIARGAIFYRLSSKLYLLLILQFAIRKKEKYKENLTMIETIKCMIQGAKKYKESKV